LIEITNVGKPINGTATLDLTEGYNYGNKISVNTENIIPQGHFTYQWYRYIYGQSQILSGFYNKDYIVRPED